MYRKVRKTGVIYAKRKEKQTKINYAGVKYSIWRTDVKCLSSFFLKDSIVILLTICAGREFQTFKMLLKKKYFASFDLKRLPMILKPLIVTSGACEIDSYIVVYVDIIETILQSQQLVRGEKLMKTTHDT